VAAGAFRLPEPSRRAQGLGFFMDSNCAGQRIAGMDARAALYRLEFECRRSAPHVAQPNERTRRRFFAPEVIQTSAMDCGPAALKCLLEGHGVRVSYGRLREACQTSVDGTSI
jgi:hypothetical protein